MKPHDIQELQARTRRGGRQFEMFAAPAREWGCMRWGVCDTGVDDGGDQ